MTFGDFVCKYYDKGVDYDGAHGFTCVDLIRQKCKEADGVKEHLGLVESAKEFYINYDKMPVLKKYYERVQCACTGQPIPSGAVVIFREYEGNPHGHVGICVRTEGDIIYLMQQDGFKNKEGAKIARWRYNSVLGWLVKREGV